MKEYDLRFRASTGSDNSSSTTFTSATSVTILGTTHNFNRMPAVTVYKTGGEEIETDINVNEATFDVTVTFNIAVSGTILLT